MAKFEISDISVVMPTYNALDLLKRTIDSLEKQLPDPKLFQVVVVDDGSTDSTRDWLEEYSGTLILDAVLLTQNTGRAAARNAGIARADRKLILMIDADMEFGPEFVLNHSKSHKTKMDVVLGKVIYDKNLGCRSYARYIETRGAEKLLPGEDIPGRYFLSGNASLSLDLLNKVGGFDETFEVHGGEDLDLGMKLEAASCNFVFKPNLQLTHLHIRKLSRVLQSAVLYGEKTIPHLVNRHPILVQQLRLDWMENTPANRLMKRIILSIPFFTILKIFATIFNNISVPDKVYDYLLYRSYYTGYQKSVNKYKSTV